MAPGMDNLRIAIVSPPWYPVPPEGYGGIELLIYLLAQELQGRGHQVTVIGSQGSHGDFELLPMAPSSWEERLGTRDQEPLKCAYQLEAHDVIRRRAFDAVHEHNYTAMRGAASEVAERVGCQLVLAGKIDEPDREYFETEIEPHLGDKVRWIENVAGKEKARLLARARAMLFPIQWEEPFGIAMVEAMASGTPVVATKRGATEEVVEPAVTGFLAEDADGLVEAFQRLGEIDPRRCAERAHERFAPPRMADGYEAIFLDEVASVRGGWRS